MYSNSSKITQSKVKMIILIIFFGFFSFFWLAGMIGGLTGDERLAESLNVYIPFLIKNIIIIYWATRRIRLCNLARMYNQYFEADQIGEITVLELAKKMGEENEKVLKELEKMIQKNFLINVHMEKKSVAKIILENPMFEAKRAEEQNGSRISINCPHCGGLNTILEGKSSICEYCGSGISAKKNAW